MNKKNLTKLALMGLLVASTEATVNATESTNSGFQSGTLLAGGGCAGGKGGCSVAWQQTPSYPSSGSRGCHAYQNQGGGYYNQQPSGYYNQQSGGYYSQQPQQSGCHTMSHTPSTQSGSYSQQGMQRSSCTSNGGCGGPKYVPSNQQVNPNATPSTQPESYSTQPQGETAWNGTSGRGPEVMRTRSTPVKTTPTNTAPPTSNPPPRYNPMLGQPSYTADNSDENMDSNMRMTSTKAMSESELLNKLNTEGKQTYWSLSPQGRSMAINLVSQGTEANAAVKEAAKQTTAMQSSSGRY